jgi:hypothetical protein
MQRIWIAGSHRNVAHRLSAGNDGAFLRGLLDLLLLIKSAAKIVDANDEHDQKRQGDGKFQQRRAARIHKCPLLEKREKWGTPAALQSENSVVPPGLEFSVPFPPALKRWAKVGRPYGAGFFYASFHWTA